MPGTIFAPCACTRCSCALDTLENAPQPLTLANGLNGALQALRDLHSDFEAMGQVVCFTHGAEPALPQFTNRLEVERVRVMVT